MATSQHGANSRSSKQRPQFTAPTGDSAASARADTHAPHTDTAREQRIAVSAYLRAVERGFAPGHELEDWLAAERDLEARGEIQTAAR